MNETISLSEALEIIYTNDKAGNPYPFDIAVRTLNRQSKTGGKLNTYKAVKRVAPLVAKENSTENIIKSLNLKPSFRKNPNHVKNRTRNIQLQNGQKKKIHIRLIDSINGKKVVY